MSRLQALLEFLTSPGGITASVIGTIWLILSLKHSWARWMLLGGAMFAASLTKLWDSWSEKEWFPHWGPIEAIVVNGRPLSILLLASLVIVSINRPRKGTSSISPMMFPIHAIQAAILLKVLSGAGEIAYIVQAAIIFVLLGITGAIGIRHWLAEDKSLVGPAIALTTAAFLFCILGIFELRVNPDAIFYSGRFIGTTANPQHAAVFLALSLLGPLYLAFVLHKRSVLLACLFSAMAIIVTYLLFLTGSRTGLCMAAILVFFLLRRSVSQQKLIGTAIILLLIAFIWKYVLSLEVDVNELNNLASRGDTRSQVWVAQWNTFQKNPLFGAPHMGGQFRSGENSWLGLMSSTGLVGLACLIWLLYQFGTNAVAIYRLKTKNVSKLDLDFCLAGLLGVFAGSFFEAYLLGIITMPVMFILMLSACCESVLNGTITTRPSSQTILSYDSPSYYATLRRHFPIPRFRR